jgi:hypothetical protein
MTASVHSEITGASLNPSVDAGALIASLRSAGAVLFDPVRLHYLETLAERAVAQQCNAKHMLDAKLMQALAAFKERFEHARSEGSEIATKSMQQYPHAADELQRLFDAGDFREVRRLSAILKSSEQRASLSALVHQLEQHSPERTAAHVSEIAQPRFELKTIRDSRNTWAKLSVDKQVTQALAHAPKNAGPINSHMLVLRSLALMRELSPDYLNRFMSYADTLLCLEQGEREKSDKPKKRQVTRAAKK